MNAEKGELLFDKVANPGGWNSFTYKAKFSTKGQYTKHLLPPGATVVPNDQSTGVDSRRL